MKASPDPQGAMTAQVVGSGVMALPVLLVVPLPPPEAVPWLLASAVLNVLAMLALVRGYEHGGFGLVYPLARAVSPLLVTLMAAVLVTERLTFGAYAGVLVVSGGVALLATGKGQARPAALGFALAAGACSAACALCDAQGSRASPSVLGYGLALSAMNAVLFGTLHKLQGRPVWGALKGNLGMATVGVAASTSSYVLILWVYGQAPVAVGAALRDTSVVFAVLISVAVLGEAITPRRAAAAAIVTLGAVSLRFA